MVLAAVMVELGGEAVGERARGCLGKAAGRSCKGFSGTGLLTWQQLMVHQSSRRLCQGVRASGSVVCSKGRLVSSVVLLLLLWAGALVPGEASH